MGMIRTSDEYRESIRDGREVWVNGQRVADVTTHPMFKPLVDIRARIYDMAHHVDTRDVMTTVDPVSGEHFAVGLQLPRTREDWQSKRRAVDAVMDDIGGGGTRGWGEKIGGMWSLFYGEDVVNEIGST